MKAKEMYREFEIYQDYPPGWWHACHKDYDGPEDGRYYVLQTRQEVVNAVDEWWEEQDEPEEANGGL